MELRRMLVSLALVVVVSTGLRAEFLNFETDQVRPLALSSNGDVLYAVNTPDNRVEIFSVTTFATDREGEEYTEDELLAAIRGDGAVLTFTVVPRRSGERIALDRDEDGVYDQDEIDGRSDPADPESIPGLAPTFVRGDGNGDGGVNIADASYLLNQLFGGGDGLPCRAAGDANGDGSIDISDAGFLLNFLFASGAAPSAPYPECGPGESELDCEVSGACEG